MNFLKRLFAGMAIGVGASIPGVSGAAIAVILKVYEEIIDAVSNFRKKFGYSIKVLIAILLGIVIALIPCVYLFSLAFEHLMFILLCIFAGFLIGSIPSIHDEVKGVKPNKKQYIVIIIAFLIVIAMGVMSVFLGPKIQLQENFDEMPVWLYFLLIPVGIISGAGLIVPGMSGSLILLILGFYRPMIDHARLWVTNLFKLGDWSGIGRLFGLIGCFGVGTLIGVIIISKLMNHMINKHHDSTYFAIIGFVIGSTCVIFFNHEIFQYYEVWAGEIVARVNQVLPIYIEIPIGIVCLGLAWLGGNYLVKVQRKHNQEKIELENKE